MRGWALRRPITRAAEDGIGVTRATFPLVYQGKLCIRHRCLDRLVDTDADEERALALGEETVTLSRRRLGADALTTLNACAILAFANAQDGDAGAAFFPGRQIDVHGWR